MLKKRLLSFFIALTLVLTSVLPSATFASNNDAENEVVENLEEGAEEEQVSEDSDKILCVSCESENVNLIIPMLNLYTCEDCGKYFTATKATNKKGIDEQIDAVEEDAKKNIEAGMFGQSAGGTITWHFVFGSDLGTIKEELPGTDAVWPDYKELNWNGIGSDIEDLDHYDFLGWSKTVGGAMKGNASGVNYKVGQSYATGKVAYSVFAKHQYVMSVEGHDDTKVTYGENFVLPSDFNLEEGQEFKGWKDADENEYAAGDTIESVDRDMQFVAIIEASEYDVKVGDGEATKIAYGDAITLPEEYDDIEGKIFTGWKDQQGNVYDKGEEVVIKGNKNFTPVYDDVYYDVYVNNENKESVKYGDDFTLPTDFEVDETEVFTGWEDEDGNTYDKGEKVAIYSEMRFAPVIALKELRTVTFDSDGGSDVEAQEVYDGLKVTKPEDPEKEHYNFDKWTLDGEEYNFDKEVTADITLKATWEAKKYTVNVDGDEQEVAYGDKVTLPTTKESSDETKTFDDYVDEDGNHYAGGSEVEVDGPKTFTAQFKEKEKFAVKYFDDTIELINLKEEVYEGLEATEKTLEDKEHYYFKGWKLSTGSKYSYETIVTSEVKLYAIWEAKKYIVNVDGEEQEVAYGDKITLPTTKESTDNTKVFDDFVDGNGNHYEGGKEVTVDGPMTFTPTFKEKNKIFVRYFDGTTELTDLKEEVYEGFEATEKALEDKEHYYFKGWNTSSGSMYSFGAAVTSEVKLYAVWEAKKYTVDIDGDKKEVSYGDKITLPTTKTSTDKTKVFDDYVDDKKNHYPGGKVVIVDGPMTFTATFKEKNKFAVRYFDGTTELADLKELVYEGFEATEKKLSNKEHYLFKGWKTSTGSIYTFGVAVTSEVKLYAVWEAKKYIINVDGDKKEVAYGDKIKLPTTKASADDTKTFDDYVDDKKNHYAGGKEVIVNGPMTFTATFKEKTKYTYNFYDGSTLVASYTKYDGQSVTAPAAPAKANHEFVGWYANTSFTGSKVTSFTAGSGVNTKYYANYKKNVFTVQFFNGTSEYAGAKLTNVTYGSTIDKPNVTIAAGKELVGWYKDSAFNNLFDFGEDTITANTKLYIKIKDIQYTVQFFNGTSEYISAKLTTVTYGSTIDKPNVTIAAGKELVGWYKDSAFKNLFDFGKDTIKANTKLYIKVKDSQYTVQFFIDSTEHTSAKLTNIAYGAKISDPKILVLAGQVLDGWYKGSISGAKFDFAKDTITENTKLYAKIVSLKYTVKIDYNGYKSVTGKKTQHYDMWLGSYHMVGDEELPVCSSDKEKVITSTATYYSTVELPDLNLHVISNDRYYTDRDVFLGYDTDKNAKWPRYKVGDKVTITGNTTFYPIFPPQVQWALNNNGGQCRKDDPATGTSSMLLPYGSQLKLRGAYKAGRTFYGWSTDPDASTATYKEGETVTLSGEEICRNNGKLTLYAVYSGPRGYVTDLRLSSERGKYSITTLQNDGYWLLKDFTDGTADINRLDKGDCGNKMYIGYKCSLSSANAITDIYATKTWKGEKTVNDGMTYYLVYVGTSYGYTDQNDKADCNDGAGGDDIYLYYTRDKRAGSPIRAGYMNLYDRNSGSPSYYSQYNSSIGKINPAIVCWEYGGTSMADLNAGCGSKSKNVFVICR